MERLTAAAQQATGDTVELADVDQGDSGQEPSAGAECSCRGARHPL